MSASFLIGPGERIVAAAVFLKQGPLFVSIVGPAAISFSSLSPSGSKEIVNPTWSTWQLFVRASRAGPIGSEVAVHVMYQSGAIALIGVGAVYGLPDALLTCAVTDE